MSAIAKVATEETLGVNLASDRASHYRIVEIIYFEFFKRGVSKRLVVKRGDEMAPSTSNLT